MFWVVAFATGVGVSIYLIMVGVAQDMQSNPVIMSFQESEITVKCIILIIHYYLLIYYAFIKLNLV